MPYPVSVGVFSVIPDERSRVLLCHRTDYDLWNLPGGRLDAGETPTTGVIREVREETGLTVEIERLVGIYSWPDEREHIFSFTAHLTSGRLTISDETCAVRFFAPDELPTNTFAEHAERIHDALASDAAPVIAVPRALSAAVEKRQR